ncbi:lanthionine synthetase C family protein [Alkalicoccobacillus porphyridii]|uniref:Lantibiotic biosynthesis protein n=1 Tax=Alkalicoccobacillus porphyridii TaxID=2597270 RepID=A0A553ZXR2_9BACI|nr:lanthionine synthetase C family protein [Alkalicoccobacillus porphyridii]TSB46224.1 lantibiotic biosynthesis protein [Alkalicoccobacillus porphyridii]
MNKMKIDHLQKQEAARILVTLSEKLKDPQKVEKIVMDKNNKTSNSKINPWDPISLSHGFAGTILFFSEMHKVYPEEKWDHVAHNHIVYASKYLKVGVASISLFGGITGFAFAVLNASENGTRYQNLLAKLDEIILREAQSDIENEKSREAIGTLPSFYDVIQGYSGIGRYLLERKEENHLFYKVIEKILHRFIKITEPVIWENYDIPGWYVSKEDQFLEKDKKLFPYGNFNLGLAHGIPGPLTFLSLCKEKGIEVPGQRKAIKTIGDWLVHHNRSNQIGTPVWPYRLGVKEEISNQFTVTDQREGWCYGNPGVGRSLYLAGKAINDKIYQEIALNCFFGIKEKTFEELDLQSATFCHGKSGLMQILIGMKRDLRINDFDQLINKLGIEIMKQFKITNPLGFKDFEIGNRKKELDKAGLLEGSAGVGLALLSMVRNDNECFWERAFLIS